MTEAIFDCIIVGAGPAGLGAAIYAARDRAKTVLLEKFYPGGQINTTDRIENYPGYANISGSDLTEKMLAQATSFGADLRSGVEVSGLARRSDGIIEVVAGKEKFLGRVAILAPGSSYRHLNVPGEDEFRNAGTGVSYCGTCDAPFFKDKTVIAVGGGNTAIEDTLHLCKFAAKVIMIHRRTEFRATKILVEELMTKVHQPNSNLTLKLDSTIAEITGDGKVEAAIVENVKTRAREKVACDGVFIFVGMVPNTAFLKGSVELTEAGFIRCEPAYLRTSVPGVFAVGDCRTNAAMQLVTAVADGVNAAIRMKYYLRDPNWWNSQPE